MSQWSEAYLQAAIDSACRAVLDADAGRRMALFGQACGTGSLVAAGALDRDRVFEILLEAGLAAGLEPKRARHAIIEGFKVGGKTPRKPPLQVVRGGRSRAGNRSGFRPTAPPTPSGSPTPPPANSPPRAEIRALFDATTWTSDDDDVAGFLRSRGIDPAAVDASGLARALPADPGNLPSWCAWWPRMGFRLMIPLWTGDDGYNLSSVRARRVVPGDGPKAVSPTGYEVRRHMFADERGKFLLRGATEQMGNSLPQVVVTEGGMDFLTWSTQAATEGRCRAVLGLFSGSWCEDIAKRVPDGSQVIVRTHHDKAGIKYAAQVNKSLAHRCEVFRGVIPT